MQSEVLAALRRRHAPMTAYDVLRDLRAAHPKIAPPTVYNALAALTKQGRAHRVESLKAYIACQCDGHQSASILSICEDCGMVEERLAPDVLTTLSGILGESGFAPQRHVIEVHGICATCGAGQTP
ncbi:Fur family transcriptional regulator [Rubrimonas cliftonensis]|nr:Fur family transcriptional regulator [Rubrimonas cliftonensis]